MKIEYLRNFIKLVNYKSFSELAHDLPISQSTISHQISQLEKDFGVILINRSTKKFEITEAGKIFLDYSQKIIDLFDSCILDLDEYRKQKFDVIVISASTTPGSHILPKYIAEFRDKNPNTSFKININNSRSSLENIVKDLADFAGIGAFINYSADNFDVIKIGEDKLKFICSTSHNLLEIPDGKIVISDLKKYPFVFREKGSGMRNAFEQQFSDHNKLKIKLEMNDNDSIISAVSESNYISVTSEIMANKAEKAGLIRTLMMRDHPIIAKRDLYFIKLKAKELSKLKKEFWKYIKDKEKK